MRYSKEIKSASGPGIPAVKYYYKPGNQTLSQLICNIIRLECFHGEKNSLLPKDLIKWLKTDFDMDVKEEDILLAVAKEPDLIMNKEGRITAWRPSAFR